MKSLTIFVGCLLVAVGTSVAQKKNQKAKKSPAPFSWVSPSKSKNLPAGVKHGTFKSSSMGIDVGYYIYLPPGYDEGTQRYPVVYHLHGGRPGAESKSFHLASFVHAAIEKGTIEPTIYVFPNGGPMSWYNYPQKEDGLGEDVFVNEAIPHIDKSYRTIGKREGRALEGFSQGGRGTTRIMFKNPQLFISTAPGGSGYEPEKRIQENNGAESATVKFAPGYNAWDLAKKFADKPEPPLNILLWVGTKGFNYDYNLKFSDYLDELKLKHEMLVVPEAPHSAKIIYEKNGNELMQFHQKNFAKAKG